MSGDLAAKSPRRPLRRLIDAAVAMMAGALLMLAVVSPAEAQPSRPAAAAQGAWSSATPSPSSVFPHALATSEASAIEVLGQQVENRFPTEIELTLDAESDSAIDRVTLYWRAGDDLATSYAYADFQPVVLPRKDQPGANITAKHTIDLRRSYIPPGVPFHYQWLVEAQSGERLRTEWATFDLVDARFNWTTLRQENIELDWYSGSRQFGQALLDVAVQAMRRLETEAGATTNQPVKVLIYGDERSFQSALGPGAHEWAGGETFARYAVTLILAPPSDLDFARRAIPHELSHIIVHQITKNPYGDIPRWLDEGLAMLAEGDADLGFATLFDEAVAQDRLISVKSLSSNFPTDSAAAQLSYAESYNLVKFIIDHYGRDKLAHLLTILSKGSAYDDALEGALGVDTVGLEAEWRMSLGLEAVPVATASPGEPTPASGDGAGGNCAGSIALVSAVSLAGLWLRGHPGRREQEIQRPG